MKQFSQKFGPDIFILFSFLSLYCLFIIQYSLKKPLWYDEFLTLYISTTPDLKNLPTLLSTGMDVTPPGLHLLTRLSIATFGLSELSLRLPSVIGVGILCCSQYLFLRISGFQRIASIPALVLPCITQVFAFAPEARGYGILLGAVGLAVLCRKIAGDEGKPIPLFFMWFSIIISISAHYYAVFSILTIIISEILRALQTRKVIFRIWIGLLSPFIFFLSFFPLVSKARGMGGKKSGFFGDAINFYSWLFSASTARSGKAFVLTACILIACWYCWKQITQNHSRVISVKEKTATFTTPDWLLVCLFILQPFGLCFIGYSITQVFTERYALTSIIGITFFAAYIFQLPQSQSRFQGLMPATIFCFFFVVLFGFDTKEVLRTGISQSKNIAIAEEYSRKISSDINGPIIVDPFYHYGIKWYFPEQSKDMIHVIGVYKPGLLGQKSFNNLTYLMPFKPNEIEFEEFIKQNSFFYVRQDNELFPIDTELFIKNGFSLKELQRSDSFTLFEARKEK